MSWFARSIANSLRLEPDPQSDSDEEEVRRNAETGRKVSPGSSPAVAAAAVGNEGEDDTEGHRGVRDDISELTQTITRQLWGVASFLAPPPQTRSENPAFSGGTGPDPPESEKQEEEHQDASDSPRFAGIRSDFAEIGGRFRSGISRLSSNKAVTEISKIASTFLPFAAGEEDEDDEEGDEEGGRYGSVGAIGVTDEVLAFAKNISMHPETWLDFPLLPDEDDADDFDMSDAQQEHALAVEHLAPRLAALRIELCPSHMSEGCFWKIYFVLLHPRLNKEDAERLSTPQIVEARALLLQELQNRTKSESDRLGRSASYTKDPAASTPPSEHPRLFSGGFVDNTLHKTQTSEGSAPSTPTADSEMEKHPVVMTEIEIVDKNVVEEQQPSYGRGFSSDNSKVNIEGDDDGDEWLREEDDSAEMTGSRVPFIPIGNDEDVSFSDLEDDDDRTTSSKMTSNKSTSEIKESKDWVQLNTSSQKDATSTSPDTKEANDWLNIDDIDDV